MIDVLNWTLTICGCALAVTYTGLWIRAMWLDRDVPREQEEEEEQDHDEEE